MGYHLVPGALTALIAGRLFGGGTCYQQTGGPTELDGGGYRCENRVQGSLGLPSPALERLQIALTREFDRVIVRGTKSRRYLIERDAGGRVHVITGSITPKSPTTFGERDTDLVFVGRLSYPKRPLLFVDVVHAVLRSRPEVTAMMLGDGAQRAAVEARIQHRGLEGRISVLGARADVSDWLLRSRLLVQTSSTEGMPVAVLEAMSCGTPVIVSDVGDVSDWVENGVTGWRVDRDDVDAYAERILETLSDADAWRDLSRRASEVATARASRDAVAARWSESLAPWRPGHEEQNPDTRWRRSAR